jgi:steroid 5-alpha reductase family enzyme
MLIILALALIIGLVFAMTAAWIIVVQTEKTGWVDVFWSYAVGVAGIAAALFPVGEVEPFSSRRWLVAAIVAVWALRLGTHILFRTLKGGDDPRYAQLRQDWGACYRGRLLGLLLIQAAVGFVLALCVLIAAHNPEPLGLWDGLGVLVALAAVVGEGISDAQLTAFKRHPSNKGRVCDSGLWSLSRHPNYFFEWLAWVAYPVIAIGSWSALAACAAPVLMYWLLVKVSGIPPLEAHMLHSRPEAFRAYQHRVRPFWPLAKSIEVAP